MDASAHVHAQTQGIRTQGSYKGAHIYVGRPLQSESDKKRKAKGREEERWERIVASVISATRQDLDMTQEDLGGKLGWTRDAVSNLENGRRHIRVSDLIVIAKAFRMEPDALLKRILRWREGVV
jgi:DNA-binding XRE family transcriptional regulator